MIWYLTTGVVVLLILFFKAKYCERKAHNEGIKFLNSNQLFAVFLLSLAICIWPFLVFAEIRAWMHYDKN